MRILLATRAIDMRRGIDGLSLECRSVLEENPMSGAIFIFINRSRKMIRILSYDGQGYWLCTKRLSKGRFPWWPERELEAQYLIEAHGAHILLRGGNPELVHTLEPWKRIGSFTKKRI